MTSIDTPATEPRTAERQRTIANTIVEQIGTGALMSLGATDFRALPESSDLSGGLAFTARILSFMGGGHRSRRPRRMTVTIGLDWSDTYRINVSYHTRNIATVHYSAADIYADQLPTLLLALDYDGAEPLNPRLYP